VLVQWRLCVSSLADADILAAYCGQWRSTYAKVPD
jgi:hypothetical protein